MPRNPVQQGEIARLLMQNRGALYGYILACVRDHHGAEDIFQNVSVAVIQSFEQLQDESGFLPWAREIARRRILSFRRNSQREQPLDPELVQRLSEAAERVDATQDPSRQQAALRACLESLPPASRKLIASRYDGTGDAEELAGRFGRSVQGIYAQVKRIKTALRNCVERRLAAEW